jgi:hypothetical protein
MSQIERTTPSGAENVDLEYSDPSKLPAAPLVTVDMITYQHASFIKEALDSVLMQKVQFPYEICLGEDGSTDGTREICIEYAKRHADKIRLFLRNRSNPARNSFKAPYMFNAAATFDACRGKYIALLEGDDCWLHPNKLQLQVNQLESDPALAASCHFAAAVQEDKPWSGSITPNFPMDSATIEGILRRDVGNLHTSTWLLRRGKPMQWEGFKSCSFGDYPILVWTLLQGTARVLPRVWSLYRIHGQGVFSSLSNEIRLRENVGLWECLKALVPADLHSAVDIGVCRTLIMYIAELRKAGKYGPALACFRRTLSQIASVRSSATERRQLRLLALESLVIPRLRGLRNRWHERQF